MNKREIAKKSITGTIIVFSIIVIQFLTKFITQIYLARLLYPETFGIAAYTFIFSLLFQTLTNFNTDRYVIKERTDIKNKFDAGFTFELLTCIVLFPFFLFVSPIILNLIHRPELASYVQILTLTIFYNPLSKIKCLSERELNFIPAKLPLLLASILGSAFSIILAHFGMEVWCLIFQRLSILFFEVVALWVMSAQKPSLSFNWKYIRPQLHFAWPLFLSSLLSFCFANADYYIVGKVLSTTQLGFYWFAFQATHTFMIARNALVNVFSPAFAKVQDKNNLIQVYSLLTRSTAAFWFAAISIMLTFGDTIIPLIYGSKWAPSVTCFKILTAVIGVRFILIYWDPIFVNFGNTIVMLKMMSAQLFLIVTTGYFATKMYGINGMAITVLIGVLSTVPIGLYSVKKVLPVSLLNSLFFPLLPSIVVSIIYILTDAIIVQTIFFKILLIIVYIIIYSSIFISFERVSIKQFLNKFS